MSDTRPTIDSERLPRSRCCDPAARPTRSFDQAASVAADLAVLAHPVRLQLLDVLARNPERVCVCDLEAAVPVKQPTVSHHLRLLREAGLVEVEKVGIWAHYRVNEEALDALRARIADLLELPSPHPPSIDPPACCAPSPAAAPRPNKEQQR